MKKNITLMLLVLILLSCQHKPKSLHEAFKKTEALVHQNSMNSSDYLMGSPGKMLLVDSFLITLDYTGKHFFHLFNIDKNEYIGNWGAKGQGPQDFLHPTAPLYLSSHDFLSYDMLDKSLKRISIDAMKKGEVKYLKALSFNSLSHISILPAKDNNYLGFGSYESNMFKIINAEGEEVGSFIDFPLEESKNKKDISNRNLAMAYQGSFAVSPNKNKFVYVALNGTVLGIYNINNNSIEQDFLLAYDYPQFTTDNSNGGVSSPLTKESICGFLDVYVTDKYIYALYCGNNISELKQKAFESKDIYVFDWAGHPVMHYSLDIPINNIAVSFNNKKIYAIGLNPEPTLVEYEINL